MSHQDGMSNVGGRRTYEGQDQQHYTSADISEAGRTHGVNTSGYQDSTSIMDKLQAQDTREQISDRMKHEPGFAAKMHGNKPSRGAEIDAELAADDAAALARKAGRTDGLPGKKLGHGAAKSG